MNMRVAEWKIFILSTMQTVHVPGLYKDTVQYRELSKNICKENQSCPKYNMQLVWHMCINNNRTTMDCVMKRVWVSVVYIDGQIDID